MVSQDRYTKIMKDANYLCMVCINLPLESDAKSFLGFFFAIMLKTAENGS